LDAIKVRSVLTCEAIKGVCGKCYGRNLANGRMIDIGEAVGVMAAQSIGEPGTQLTLRTFHIGGAASRMTAESAKKTKWDCKVALSDVETVTNPRGEEIVVSRSGEVSLLDDHGLVKIRYVVPYGSVIRIKDGDEIKAGSVLFEWDPYNTLIISRNTGKIEFDGLKEGVTYAVEYDEGTGMERLRITRDKRARLHPHINVIENGSDVKLGRYSVPENAYLQFNDGDSVNAGDALVKIARAAGKTRDITGGLPRVAELFEARRPKSPAVVTAIDGIVEFGDVERGQQRIIVQDGEIKDSYLVPRGKHVTVHPGDRVRSGDKLCDGPIDPHDILAIAGDAEVQKYLVEEIQAVYRLQGVTISDKHIESIVRQMMRKVVIENAGDTDLLEGEEISKARLRTENTRVLAENGAAATFRPLLLGITKASLGTDSFISAASFQETTKVLTAAAIAGKVDTLEGLKENVIMGRLIPSGTGNQTVNGIRVKDLDAEAEEEAAMAAAAHELASDSNLLRGSADFASASQGGRFPSESGGMSV
jgi:DNA-directed RNA polymerase subunit beta'